MSDTLLGSFETTNGKMQKMLRWASAPFDVEERYDQAYVNLFEGGIRTIANAGEAVAAYCDFTEPFVKNIELHDAVDEQAGCESIIKVPRAQSFLHFVGGDELTVEIYGDEDTCRADYMVFDGDLQAKFYVPSSESDYESKQLGVVKLYDEEENWVKPSNEEPLQTSFTTTCEEFNRIIEVISYDDFSLVNYPVVVEDGEFLLDASDENNKDSVTGKLYAEDVEGEDVSNYYSRGFEQLFDNISGEIDVQIEQDAPISIVRQSNDNALTLRYSILPTEE